MSLSGRMDSQADVGSIKGFSTFVILVKLNQRAIGRVLVRFPPLHASALLIGPGTAVTYWRQAAFNP